MKKCIQLIVIALFAMVLVACGGTEETTLLTTESTTSTAATTTQTTTQTTSQTTSEATTTATTTEEPTYEILDLTQMNWIDDNEISDDTNNPYRGQPAYTLSDNTNKLSLIQPHKFDKYNSLTLDLSEYDLTTYRKIKVTGQGDGVMKLIINSDIRILNDKNIISYPLSIINDSFEFSLDFDGYEQVRSTIQSITIIFGAEVNEDMLPNHRFTSEIQISTFMFTEEPSDPLITYNTQGVLYDPNNEEPTDPIVLVQNWNIFDSGSYIITEVEDGYQIVTTTEKQEWGFINLILEGNFQGYTQIVIEVQGDAGAKFKMKLEGTGITTYETGSTANGNILDPILNGEIQTFVWNVSAENLPAGQAVMFIIFFEPGQTGTGAEMVIRSITLE